MISSAPAEEIVMKDTADEKSFFPSWMNFLGFLLHIPTKLKLLGRRLQVYLVAYQIYSRYSRAEKLAEELSGDELEEMWSETHASCAQTAVYHAKSLLGLWIKLGQFLSSRSDVLPEEWVHELSSLQDAIPARPLHEVERTIREEWQVQHWNELLDDLSPEPIAAASIAQVHTAVIASNGQKIALKVQHRGVADLLRQDLENAAYLLDCIAEEKPELDFRPILNEWCLETRAELDFIKEAQSTQEVGGYLAEAAAKRKDKYAENVRFPRTPNVIRVPVGAKKKSSAGKWWWQRTFDTTNNNNNKVWGVRPTMRLLPLEFIDGVKPTDREGVLRARGNAEGVLRDLADAFGHNIFVDSVFNGDPHPGNIMIDKHGAVVLLDFGLTKRLQKRTRLGIARLVVASADGDVSGVLRATRELGLDEVIDDPSAAIHVTRFLFRDATPPAQSSRSKKPAITKSKDRHVSTQEAVLTTPTRASNTLKRSIEVPEDEVVELNVPIEDLGIRIASNDFEEGDDESASSDSENDDDDHPAYLSRATGKLYPSAATPGTILFVLRVIGCLRGIAVQLGVSQSYLGALRPHAVLALQREQSQSQDPGPPLPLIGNEWVSLRLRVVSKLQALVAKSGGGIQLAAFVRGQLVLNEAAGVHGPSDQRKISPNTLFSVFSCGKGVASALALSLAEDKLLNLDAKISEQPVEASRRFFIKRDGLNTRLSPRDFLEHKAGLALAFPPKFAKALSSLDAAYFAPGKKTTSKNDDTKPWRDALRWFRRKAIPDPKALGHFQYHAVSFGWLVGGLCELAAGAPYPDILNTRIGRPLGIANHLYARLPPHYEDDDAVVWNRLADVCISEDEIDRSDNGFFAADPRLINEPSLRSIMLPSATMHASAYGLATIFGALANHGALADGRRFLSAATVDNFIIRYREALSSPDNGAPFGFRPYLFNSNSTGDRYGFGHAGLGQLHCIADPDTGIGIAVCINDLSSSPGSNSAAEEAIAFAVNELTQGTSSVKIFG